MDVKMENILGKTAKSIKRFGIKGAVKTLISIVSVLLILCGGALVYAGTNVLGGLSTTTISKDRDSLGIASGVYKKPKVISIALFGLDARGDSFKGLSDSIMVLTFDEIHNKLKIISVLRDSRVYIGEGITDTSTGWDKITHAYSYEGAPLSIKTLNSNFGLYIENYVTVNFNNLAKIVDSFGGVEIEVSSGEIEHINKNLTDLRNEGADVEILDSDIITASAGKLTLNGNQSVAYSRIRLLDNDFVRAERQQNVIKALLARLDGIALADYPGIIQKLSPLCETSLSVASIMEVAPMMLGDFTVETLVIPGEDVEGKGWDYMENGRWMWTYDVELAARHIESFITEEPINTAQSQEATSVENPENNY